jgi:cell division protein FtsQ
VSVSVRHRRPGRRLVVNALLGVAAVALTATLAVALQVREVRVAGTHRFPANDVKAVLDRALGSPTVAARAGALRASVRALPWVADAPVRVSLDGVVSCAVVERDPVAVAVDGGSRRLVDAGGRILADAGDGGSLLELDGFGPFPEERSTALAAVGTLERCWGAGLVRIDRVGPHDVGLHFSDIAFPVLADPGKPGGLVAARRVLAAWIARHQAPVRLDARVTGIVAVMPAPPAPEEGE